MVIFLNLIFRIPWFVAVIIMVLTSVILGLTEGISVPLLAQLFNLNLEDIISDPLLRIMFTLPHLALLAGLTFISTRHGWRLPLYRGMVKNVAGLKDHIFTGRNYLLIILCLVQALMLVLLNISFYIYMANIYPSFTLNTLVLTSSIVIIASALATIFVAGYLLKLTEREARIEIELRHVKEMQNLNRKMQVERHDFYNHLTAVYGYLKADKYKQAEGYIETLYENVRQINNLIRVNPPELGALLSVKKEEAKTQGIDFNWQVNVESAILPLSPEELTELIGNLLDNALEAAFLLLVLTMSSSAVAAGKKAVPAEKNIKLDMKLKQIEKMEKNGVYKQLTKKIDDYYANNDVISYSITDLDSPEAKEIIKIIENDMKMFSTKLNSGDIGTKSFGDDPPTGSNNISYSAFENADIILVHDGFCAYGYYRHGGTYDETADQFISAQLNDQGNGGGVIWEDKDWYQDNYDEAIGVWVPDLDNEMRNEIIDSIMNYLEGQLGKPYSLSLYSTRSSWYCTKLP